MLRLLWLILALVILSGCASNYSASGYLSGTPSATVPKSSAEANAGYTYIPIDPLPVTVIEGTSCIDANRRTQKELLSALPDNAVRMLIERIDLSGALSYGVGKSTLKGESYRVTVDYINADTINLPVWIRRSVQDLKTGDIRQVDLNQSVDLTASSELYSVSRDSPKEPNSFERRYNLPVYIGVGLRAYANVQVLSEQANVSGIGEIGADAQADRLKGSLVVQTIGVNGKSVGAALPIQSELNRTTAQNAIVAIATIKALLYAKETIKVPRVVGFYIPFPGGKPLVNALISLLSQESVKWTKECPDMEMQ